MKRVKKQTNCKGAFTIIELLTVMSIIVVLIGLLVPSLNAAKRYAKQLKQKAQLKGIDSALELFQADHGNYPPSDDPATPVGPDNYCGAMKLAEAMVGQDLLGFHPDSKFRSDGEDGLSNELYPVDPAIGTSTVTDEEYAKNLKLRTGPYLAPDSANAYPLSALYPNTGSDFDPCSLVLCDVYTNVTNLSTKGPSNIGMPILYYRADVSKTRHDTTNADNVNNIYNYLDNDKLVELGLPTNQNLKHIIDSGGTPAVYGMTPSNKVFYEITMNPQIDKTERPYRADSYILISAGFDGVYGTSDDIFNFNK